MTTVIWNGTKLVSDSQVTQGNMAAPSPFRKIYEPEEGEYWEVYGTKVLAFGISGNANTIAYIQDKLREGITHRTRFEDSGDMIFSALIVDENGNCYRWLVTQVANRTPRHELAQMLPPVSVGSGATYAYAVMSIGRSIELAMKTACKLDKYSGGEMVSWEFPGKPEKKSVRPVVVTTAPATA